MNSSVTINRSSECSSMTPDGQHCSPPGSAKTDLRHYPYSDSILVSNKYPQPAVTPGLQLQLSVNLAIMKYICLGSTSGDWFHRCGVKPGHMELDARDAHGWLRSTAAQQGQSECSAHVPWRLLPDKPQNPLQHRALTDSTNSGVKLSSHLCYQNYGKRPVLFHT